MKKLFICVLTTILLLFVFTVCGKSEPVDKFGECAIALKFEDLTQDEFTSYLQEAYGI